MDRSTRIVVVLGAGALLAYPFLTSAAHADSPCVYDPSTHVVTVQAVPDLPNQAVTRFGRVDVFGQGPVNGVCPAPAVASQCTNDGYVSKNAVGYRLVGGLRYANVFDGADLVPAILFGQDLYGWSGDGGILEGRKLAVLSLRLNMKSGFVADIAWLPTWGGTYNNQRDRSAIFTYIGQRF